MDAKLRRFQPEDTTRVLELANRHIAFDGEITEADLLITKYFPDGFWVAEASGQIVGFAYAYFHQVPEDVLERWEVRKVAYIAALAVDPSHRRQGIGLALLRKVVENASIAGAELIIADCPSASVGGREIFERFGFGVRSLSLQFKIPQKPRR